MVLYLFPNLLFFYTVILYSKTVTERLYNEFANGQEEYMVQEMETKRNILVSSCSCSSVAISDGVRLSCKFLKGENERSQYVLQYHFAIPIECNSKSGL